MIDTIYKVLLTIINKENQGYISPEEFNLIAINVQNEIFSGYFKDANEFKNLQNRGFTNRGYANLPLQNREDIGAFAATANGTVTAGLVDLPSDMYVIEDQGVTTSAGILIDEVERNAIAIMARSEVAPTELYPVYEWFGSTLKVYPTTITSVNFRYIRKPLNPKWTYNLQLMDNIGKEMYDPNNASFQDFELDSSEFYNIILRMLTYFGINLREPEVVKIAEIMKDKDNVKN